MITDAGNFLGDTWNVQSSFTPPTSISKVASLSITNSVPSAVRSVRPFPIPLFTPARPSKTMVSITDTHAPESTSASTPAPATRIHTLGFAPPCSTTTSISTALSVLFSDPSFSAVSCPTNSIVLTNSSSIYPDAGFIEGVDPEGGVRVALCNSSHDASAAIIRHMSQQTTSEAFLSSQSTTTTTAPNATSTEPSSVIITNSIRSSNFQFLRTPRAVMTILLASKALNVCLAPYSFIDRSHRCLLRLFNRSFKFLESLHSLGPCRRWVLLLQVLPRLHPDLRFQHLHLCSFINDAPT